MRCEIKFLQKVDLKNTYHTRNHRSYPKQNVLHARLKTTRSIQSATGGCRGKNFKIDRDRHPPILKSDAEVQKMMMMMMIDDDSSFILHS